MFFAKVFIGVFGELFTVFISSSLYGFSWVILQSDTNSRPQQTSVVSLLVSSLDFFFVFFSACVFGLFFSISNLLGVMWRTCLAHEPDLRSKASGSGVLQET